MSVPERQAGAAGDPFTEFVSRVARAVRGGGGETTITSEVAAAMQELLTHRPFLDRSVMQPAENQYVMYPLFVAEDGGFSVAAAVWGVGQKTPIHDHGTWGVVGIYEGCEREARFIVAGETGQPALRLVSESELSAGEVSVCCTRDADVHAVACASPVPCVAIHVYGTDIGHQSRHTYDAQTGARQPFVSHWATPRQRA